MQSFTEVTGSMEKREKITINFRFLKQDKAIYNDIIGPILCQNLNLALAGSL